MNQSGKVFSPRFVLLAAIDATPDAAHVLDMAATFARCIAGCELHLVHAIEPSETDGFPVAETYDRAVSRGRAYLDESARKAQARSGVRVIRAPCAECLRAQRESKGATLWCARHSGHHVHAHAHYEFPQGFGEGSKPDSLVRPQSVSGTRRTAPTP
jgi:hypothetical protein